MGYVFVAFSSPPLPVLISVVASYWGGGGGGGGGGCGGDCGS